jgi:alpha-tubulin suppressor-like RCC1 family protein
MPRKMTVERVGYARAIYHAWEDMRSEPYSGVTHFSMKSLTAICVSILFFASNQFAIGGPPAGRVIGWGDGGGEDLQGSSGDSRRYVAVDGHELTNIVAISALGLHAMALNSDGTVFVWGYDPQSKLVSVPDGISNATAVSLAGDHNLALRSDGTVLAWGSGDSAQVPSGLSNIVAIAGGGSDSLALKRDGTIERWGGRGRNGALPEELSNVVSIATCHSKYGDDLALTRDGTIVEWPTFYAPDPDPYQMPQGLSNIVAIASGSAHALALKKDGTVVSWGGPSAGFMNPDYGQTNVPVGLSNVVAIAGGPYISLALKRDGTVVVWGDNHHHQIDLAAGLSNIVAIAAGQDFCLAIQTNSPGPITNTFPPWPRH